MLTSDNQASVLLNAVALKRKPPAGNRLGVRVSGIGASAEKQPTSGAILELVYPPDEGR